mgnify:CR=1 FL=1
MIRRRLVGVRKAALPVLAVMVLFLSGCGWWAEVKEWWRPSDMARATPEGLYQKGAREYQEGRYKKAIESFQRVKERYPLHPMAIMAELGIADSHYSDKEYAEAEIAYGDFINLHPTNENLPYAMYQLGMCHFNQIGSIDRDQTETIKAKKEFEKLVARYPDSKFALLAEQNILACRKKLAEKEFYVANFYFKMKKYKAALHRFEEIAKNYAGVGLDYKVDYFIGEAKKRLAIEETKKPPKADKEIDRTKDQTKR